jgi:hypothetical protein
MKDKYCCCNDDIKEECEFAYTEYCPKTKIRKGVKQLECCGKA